MNPTALRLTAVALVILSGILAGAQLGKIAPLIGWYQEEIGLSLQGAGWLTALIGIFVAFAALPAGMAIGRMGATRATGYGSLLLVIGGLLLAASHWPAAIFGARLIEGLGYLVVCISLPAILNDVSPLRWKGPVLAIWSGFVPLGYATSDLLSAALLPLIGPQPFLVLMALTYAAFWMAGNHVLRSMGETYQAPAPAPVSASLVPAVIMVAMAFGIFVVVSVAFFTFLPSFGLEAGLLLPAGVILLTVPLGNVLAGVLVRGRGPGFMAGLAIAGFAACVLAAPLAFGQETPAAMTVAAMLLAVASAVVASSLFAAIPFVTPAGGSVAVALGIVSQAGGMGTLIGPPLAAFVVENYGWAGLGWFMAGAAALGIFCMAPLAATAFRRPA
jgi:MFS family permease